MCTVTWWHRPDGYSLFFNRDERRSRPRAHGPRVFARRSIRWIAPVDPQGGGSWIAANTEGIAICLLNAYVDGSGGDGSERRSRGLLVRDLAEARDLDAAAELLSRLVDEHRYEAFHLLAIAPAGQRWWRWDGARLEENTEKGEKGIITTSSFEASSVVPYREKLYQDLVPGVGEGERRARHERFHRLATRERAAFSPLMARPDAQTVSISCIDWSPGRVVFGYVECAEAAVRGAPSRIILGEDPQLCDA